ncbi:uncharacterized protein LOC144754565 isoform X2 [Lissotriton helveticus]
MDSRLTQRRPRLRSLDRQVTSPRWSQGRKSSENHDWRASNQAGATGDTAASEEESLAQSLLEDQLSGLDLALSSSDDKDQPGTSGVSHQAAPPSQTTAAPAATPTTSGHRLKPTARPRTPSTNSTGPPATQEATNDDTSSNTQGGPRSTVPATRGTAHVSRGGGSDVRQRSRSAEGPGLPDDSQLVRIIDVYQDSTGGFSQVVGVLKDLQQEQAGHHACMEAKWDKVTGVLSDILTCLRQNSSNMSTPPCVPTTSLATTSANATGREAESGLESDPTLPPVPEDPPQKKKNRGRPKEDK